MNRAVLEGFGYKRSVREFSRRRIAIVEDHSLSV